LLAKHQQELGLLQHRMQIESKELQTMMMTAREQKPKERRGGMMNDQTEAKISARALSEDEKQSRILLQTAEVLTEAEAERKCLEENSKSTFQAQQEVKNMLLAKHEEERVRLEMKTKIDIAELVVLEKQMHDDVGEFEEKIKVERKRRLFTLAQEEKKMDEESLMNKQLSEIRRKAMIDNQKTNWSKWRRMIRFARQRKERHCVGNSKNVHRQH